MRTLILFAVFLSGLNWAHATANCNDRAAGRMNSPDLIKRNWASVVPQQEQRSQGQTPYLMRAADSNKAAPARAQQNRNANQNR